MHFADAGVAGVVPTLDPTAEVPGENLLEFSRKREALKIRQVLKRQCNFVLLQNGHQIVEFLFEDVKHLLSFGTTSF